MNSNSIGTLQWDLVANVAQIQRDAEQIKKLLGGAMDGVTEATNLAKSALTGLIGVGSVAGLAAIAKNAIDAAEKFHDLSIQTGASVEALSSFAETGKYTDTSVATIASAMGKLAKNMAGATEDSKGAGQALKDLGINVEQFQRLKPEDQMLVLAKRLDEFEDGGGKAARVMALLGKNGAELLPWLKDLASRGKDAATVTKEQADQADQFNDRITELRASFEGMVRTVTLDALPTLIKLLEATGEAVKVTAAYLVLVKGMPMVVALASNALKELAVAKTAAAGAGGLLSASIAKTAASAKVLVAELGLLKIAANVMFAAFAGWEIGSWAYEQFGMVRVAGAVMVESMLVGWEAVKLGTGVAWAGIKAAVFTTLDAITGGFATMVEYVAKGLRALGAKDTAVGLEEFAQRARTATSSGFNLGEQLKKLKSEYDKNVASVRAITKEMTREALGLNETGIALAEKKKKLKDTTDETDKTKDANRLLNETLRQQKEALEAAKKAHDDTAKSLGQSIEQLQKEVETQREANLKLTQGEAAVSALEVAKLREMAATADRNALLAGESALNSDLVTQYMQQAKLLRERADLLEEGTALKEAKATAEEWKKTTDSIETGLTDAIFRGAESGKGIFQNLVDTLKGYFDNLVLRPIIQAVMAPVAGAIGSILGTGGAGTLAGGSGAGGLLGQLGSLFGGGSGIGGMLGGLSGLVGKGLINLGSATGISGIAQNGINLARGTTSLGMNALGGIGGSLLGGAIAGNYGKSWVTNASAMIGSLFGPIGGIVGGIIGGVANRLFGMGPKKYGASGVEGSFISGDFSGQTFADWTQKGGLFRKNKRGTEYGAIPDDMAAAFDQGGASVFAAVQGYAQALKLPADALKDVSYKLRVTLTEDEKANQEAITKAFGEYEQALAGKFADVLAPFQQAGETVADTLSRMAGLQAFSESINEYGGIFSKVAQLSVSAREELLGFAGGMESFIAKTQSFVENYYSDAEKFGLAAKGIREQLAALGITQDVSSRADFRAIVEAVDVSSTAGREQLNALLDLAQQFAPVAQYLEQQNTTLGELADKAPQSALLESVLKDQEANAAYQERLTGQVDQLNGSILSIGDLIAQAIASGNAESAAILQAILAQTAATARQLVRWDASGQLSTTTETP